jgi:hypothetical protein
MKALGTSSFLALGMCNAEREEDEEKVDNFSELGKARYCL